MAKPNDVRAFAAELGDNPQVFERENGYHMVFRYSLPATERLLTFAVRTALVLGVPLVLTLVMNRATGAATPFGPSFIVPLFLIPTMIAFTRNLDIPYLAGRLTMDFTGERIGWVGPDSGGTAPCTAEDRPVIQVEPDQEAQAKRARRIIKSRSYFGGTGEIYRVVATSGPFGLHLKKIVSIEADNASEQAIRLAAAINLLIEATALKLEAPSYVT